MVLQLLISRSDAKIIPPLNKSSLNGTWLYHIISKCGSQHITRLAVSFSDLEDEVHIVYTCDRMTGKNCGVKSTLGIN